MSNKFANNLSASNKDIKKQRAKMVADRVELECSSLVAKLKKEKMTLDHQIMDLTDLAPNSKDSLRPTSEEFCAATWVKTLHEAKLELALKKVELKEAEKIYKEWFEVIDEDETDEDGDEA